MMAYPYDDARLILALQIDHSRVAGYFAVVIIEGQPFVVEGRRFHLPFPPADVVLGEFYRAEHIIVNHTMAAA